MALWMLFNNEAPGQLNSSFLLFYDNEKRNLVVSQKSTRGENIEMHYIMHYIHY